MNTTTSSAVVVGQNAMVESEDAANILCPLCGSTFKPMQDGVTMCNTCLKGRVDITEGVSKQVTIFFCRGCGRYNKPPYINAELESRELLSLCLKKIKGITKDVKLVDASFVWTEPHSRRIKVKVTIQKEVFKVIMQQSCVVEFIVANQQCTDCQKSYTEHTWTSCVQLRQKASHKRTFFWLEQLLLKHNVTAKCQNIKEQPEGLDFYWTTKSQAMALLSFLQSVVAIRSTAAKRLISADLNSNVANFKYTFSVEIAPICKDDLVAIPPKLAASLGGCSTLLLCTKVTNTMHLIDVTTLQSVDIIANQYWRNIFGSLMNSRQLVEFIVIDIEKQSPGSVNPFVNSSKYALAEVTIARATDLGENDTMITCLTHMGNILRPGDHVLGYDLSHANFNGSGVKLSKGRELPEVILVKKHYPHRKDRARKRRWELRQLNKELSDNMPKKHEVKKQQDDYEDFMRDLEEDPEMAAQINLYRRDAPRRDSITSTATETKEDEDDQFPGAQLDAMLEKLNISSETPVPVAQIFGQTVTPIVQFQPAPDNDDADNDQEVDMQEDIQEEQ